MPKGKPLLNFFSPKLKMTPIGTRLFLVPSLHRWESGLHPIQ
jgi:hypothetical protein